MNESTLQFTSDRSHDKTLEEQLQTLFTDHTITLWAHIFDQPRWRPEKIIETALRDDRWQGAAERAIENNHENRYDLSPEELAVSLVNSWFWPRFYREKLTDDLYETASSLLKANAARRRLFGHHLEPVAEDAFYTTRDQLEDRVREHVRNMMK